ncbi:DUF1707 domain-containing protein [Saxibacter everestensis]|uniref:DUF1707 domain-containing protein n=1 Tax=Saxibacter everestensis TaxID=2909229 RepID=A0ABY8QPS3_9MICO|nr:DUF1707 domain-containing protein [Brevibacteriaceae bacterium ZFBP1038]
MSDENPDRSPSESGPDPDRDVTRPPDVSRGIRASDADRERIGDILREAYAAGRLDHEELEERTAALWRCKYVAELGPLVDDLPAVGTGHPSTSPVPVNDRAPAQREASVLREPGGAREQTTIAVLGGDYKVIRPGAGIVRSINVMGGDDIDLLAALAPGESVVIESISVMGGADIIVPEGTRVITETWSFLGGDEVKVHGDGSAGTLVLKGFSMMGGNTVRRAKPKELRQTGRDKG